MKKYILTGGPGTGKSSLILALEARGEYAVREVAEDYIRLEQAHGVKEPWQETHFQDRILQLQLQRESRVHPDATRVFLDRGVPDGLAYTQPGTETHNKIREEAKKAKYETKVFLIEHLTETQKTEVRRENREEAIKLGQKLETIYQQLGHQVIRITAGTVTERLEQILAETEG